MYKGLKRATCALLIVLAFYALLGFLILPGIALRVVNQQLATYAKVPAHLERLQLNPFSLELTLWGLEIGEPDKRQVGFERLYVNLELDSLWTGALHLAAVDLDKPTTEVLFAKDGTLNLTQLFQLPPSEPKADEPPAGDPFPVRIDSIRLAKGGVRFQDLRPSEPIEFVYDALDLELKNLSTLRDDNADMLLVATGPYGGRIDWKGSLSLLPLTSEGELKVTDGNMKGFWPYVRDAVPLVLDKGTVSLSTRYHLSLAEGTALKLEQTAIKVAPFAIKAPDGRPLVNLESLEVSDSALDLAKQQVVVGKIRSQNLETWAAREADGQLDWQKLFASEAKAPAKSPATPDAKPADAAAKPAPAAAPAKPWQVLLRDTQLRGYKVHLADRAQKDAVQIDVGPLNLDLKDFDSLGQSPFQLALDTGIGKQGKLKAEGQVQLTPTTAKLKVETRDIDLRVAQAYLAPFVRLELRSGMLDSNLDVALTSTEPLALTITGRALVNQLHTLDTLKQRDFVKWQQLLVEGLDYRHGSSLSIAKVGISQPYARFIINEDLTTNVSDLVIKQPADPKAKAEPAGKPLDIHIGAVSISNGSANFADFSLTPNFATAIQQLNGEISTLDTRTRTPAKVSIDGKVDRYAPVTIKGALTPFDPLDSLDIATSFKRVELTTLTPYSGKFAGYRIRKGRLNLDLHYQIEKGQLKADNHLVLENLQLGERVDSPDAVDLPIRLAVALLKDTEGKIDIQLPVAGNLNDPQFSVAPIVWQTLRNLVLRAAQAPFKFVAGLVTGGGEHDLSNVPFDAGSAELSANAQKGLDTLAQALQERPALRLEIEGMSATAVDGPLLAAARLEREYQSTYYKIAQRRGDKVPADASLMEVPDSEKPPMLEGIYRARLKQQPPAEWTQLGNDERTAKMRDAVVGSWAQSELLLRQLAQARAAAIKAYLVDRGGLQDERVYMLDVSLGEAGQDGRVDTPLQLGTE